MQLPAFANSPAARQAILVSGLAMAWQLAAKTTRDSLFLGAFPATALPGAVGAAAVCSILVALFSTKLVHRFGPYRLIPSVFLLGGALHVGEWMLLGTFPRPVAAFLYIHIMALGPVMLSGFWALVSERFDPREARRRFGQIAAAGTLGSLAGGVMAERVAALSSSADLLILLTALQLAGSVALFRFAPAQALEKSHDLPSLPEIISGAPYLIGLAAFVMLVSMGAAGLDFLFRSRALAQFGKGPGLSRFFAIFYTSISLATFVVQAGVSRIWLKRFGPGRTVSVLPVAVTGASLVSLLVPGAVAIFFSRGLEVLLRGSLFRSGYELFYTPMPATERRSVKTVIDIGADRLGEGLAAASIQLLLVLPVELSSRSILAATAVWSGIAAWLAFRLDRAYVAVLEKGLARQTVVIRPEDTEDAVTHSVVLRSMPTMVGLQGMSHAADGNVIPPSDVALIRLAELRSSDPLRARAALHGVDLGDPLLVPQVIQLLGRDETARAAHEALCRVSDHIAGQLADRLADPAENEKVRRRIPRVLASAKNPIAWQALLGQLDDERFEIRQRCARGLEKMLQGRPEFRPDSEEVFEIVRKELTSSRKSLSKASAVAAGAEDAEGADLVDEVLRERASHVMTHIATLLALVLPAESVRLAFRALHTEDAKLRGVALEYLDSVLPKGLREKLAAQIEGPVTRPEKGAAAAEQALANLMDESPSIIARLEDLRNNPPRGKGPSAH